ncbi:hypothetical protein [Sandaracinus amylolyticus]|uniref:hypothetical protein n=1 Tax=Sandaracinus amylolyticus TaxID=927083 RepID=UPI0012EE5063|nr:hypothetical protein [Sandaracinus amylolyticus]
MIASLGMSMVEAVAVGDLEAARVAHAAIGHLLTPSAPAIAGAEIVELAGWRPSTPTRTER